MRSWFRSRANIVTLGAQAVVIDVDNRVLLIRHSHRSGWHFPGGGVERGETVEQALVRELQEETGLMPTAAPQLIGFYAHFDEFPGDHIALYRVTSWQVVWPFRPTMEISECSFFHLNNLPEATTQATRARLAEIFDGAPASQHW